MTVPRGWQVMRLQTRFEPAPPSGDDLLALVEVIRDVAGDPPPENSGMPDMTEPANPRWGADPTPRSGDATKGGADGAARFTVIRGDLDD